YWRFLSHVALGLIRVRCTSDECLLVVVGRPLVLLAFKAPDLAQGDDGVSIWWPITGGLLLSRDGRADPGVLRISIIRLGGHRVRAEVSVTGFVPTVAKVFGPRVYAAPQA